MTNLKLALDRKKEVVNQYGGKNLARMLGISHPAVSKWKVIPPFRAFQIAKLGDFDIEYIRPDLRITPIR
jgi:DNA-binding transcriptional regulator YdaS (Cro superfamily)|tara:strand:+ start:2914 stop:3123 length:210 start_codon:yes stop_codon:yes gene_type:complete